MKVEVSLNVYKEKHGEYLLSKGYDAEDVWTYYHKHIYWALPLISSERNKDVQPTYEQIRLALYINSHYWVVCKKTFKGLVSALQGKQIVMKVKSQLDLQREIFRNPSAKLLEMQSVRYDDEYKPKGQDTVIELPKTLEVTVKNVKKTDKELEAHAKIDD
jgi:hypothetical protein